MPGISIDCALPSLSTLASVSLPGDPMCCFKGYTPLLRAQKLVLVTTILYSAALKDIYPLLNTKVISYHFVWSGANSNRCSHGHCVAQHRSRREARFRLEAPRYRVWFILLVSPD